MSEITKRAVDSFRVNRKMAEKQVVLMKKVSLSHKHGFFCTRWSNCKKEEKLIVETETRIKDYKEAEEGIRKGNYNRAIELLERLAGPLKETPWQTAMRVASMQPTLNSIVSSPNVLAYNMQKLANQLRGLQ